MKPETTSKKMDYERVPMDDFSICTIEQIQFEKDHKFSFDGKDTIYPAIRFKFLVEGLKFPHYSRWMKFNYGEKSNLYSKFISQLVEGAKPDMDFDLENLKGMRIKILWADKNGFQYPETVRPLKNKIPQHPEIQMGKESDKDEFGADTVLPF